MRLEAAVPLAAPMPQDARPPSLAEWLRQGAPIGRKHHIEHTGVFLRRDKQIESNEVDYYSFAALHGWDNYLSVEDDPEHVQELLQAVQTGGFCAILEPAAAQKVVGTDTVPLNKLGVLTKAKTD